MRGRIDEGGARAWRIVPGVPAALDETIEPDLSNAGPFLAAAMAIGVVTDLGMNESARSLPSPSRRQSV